MKGHHRDVGPSDRLGVGSSTPGLDPQCRNALCRLVDELCYRDTIVTVLYGYSALLPAYALRRCVRRPIS